MNTEQFIELLRKSTEEAGSVSRWCQDAKLHQPYISDVLRGVRPPSPAIAAALGYRRVFSFEPVSDE